MLPEGIYLRMGEFLPTPVRMLPALQDTPFGIKWPESLFSALGTSSSYNYKLCDWENFTPKINKVRILFNILSQLDLSVYGRLTIAKTLGLSKLLFSSACICTPVRVIDTVNRLEWTKAKN